MLSSRAHESAVLTLHNSRHVLKKLFAFDIDLVLNIHEIFITECLSSQQ
jgi:hypothetical protein